MSVPLLAVQGVGKSFRLEDREVRALIDVSFDVGAGECLAIVGESGAGKSTIANLILGVYPPTSGTILLHGETLPARRRACLLPAARGRKDRPVSMRSIAAGNPISRTLRTVPPKPG